MAKKKTPIIKDKVLAEWDYEADRLIMELDITNPKEWDYWQQFLDDPRTRSFRYIGADGTSCTLVKEKQLSYGKDYKDFWYAHKRLGGKLKRKYLGLSKNLTYKKLKEIAFELCQRALF